MIIELKGRIDSVNAEQTENEILDQLTGLGDCEVVLDAAELEYVSSAGLRVILRLKKNYPNLRMVNVNSEVYEILDMTGFTEFITVEKQYRVVSIEGCEEIGHGANGTIYRIDQDNVVKVYNNADALADIQHEREVAKL
ncbi:MAG: STAS domain-containing protein, partial [Lachnospiraceae bacterium]|nr:STAS domain-containing protein [Lachnospiraceae bacterium]